MENTFPSPQFNPLYFYAFDDFFKSNIKKQWPNCNLIYYLLDVNQKSPQQFIKQINERKKKGGKNKLVNGWW